MPHWNQHFNNMRNHERTHGNENVTNRQADYIDPNFNMPYGNEGYGNTYQHNQPQHWQNQDMNDQAHRDPYYKQQMQKHEQNLRLHTGHHTENEWNKLVNWADNMQNPAHFPQQGMGNQENNRMNYPGHSQAYNPQNRNYSPMFADDESGFSGGYRSANPDNGFERDFGFDNDQAFHNRHRNSWPQNNNFNNNQQEGQNRWRNNSQNQGGFFGH